MKRLLIALTVGCGATASLGAVAVTAGATARGHAASGTIVKLRHTSRGTILVNSRGFTLYVFSRDSRNHDACVSISGCASIWPLVTTKGTPVAGTGVRRSLLGTIVVRGKRQVTYAGHPLYRYSFDAAPGETSYVGVNASGGRWWAITASGKLVK